MRRGRDFVLSSEQTFLSLFINQDFLDIVSKKKLDLEQNCGRNNYVDLLDLVKCRVIGEKMYFPSLQICAMSMEVCVKQIFFCYLSVFCF